MDSNSHSCGQHIFHLVWNTKYRYKMFRKLKNKNLTEAAIRQAAGKHQIDLEEICIADDHIHVVVNPPHSMSISRCVKLLKGVSSHLIFEEQPKFRMRYPQGSLWSVGYSTRSVGSAALETVQQYVEEHEESQATLSSYS
ncbi:MAG: IS200/IS605 family transposase [Candidatus Nanohalobium sp.]